MIKKTNTMNIHIFQLYCLILVEGWNNKGFWKTQNNWFK